MSQFSLNLIKFEDVKQQIITYLQENSEYGATFDWMGPNLSYIIDTMAYVTMLMSYQATNIANNNFLDTTSLRKNAVSIAKTMGYRPHRYKSAQLTGLLQYKTPIGTFDAWDPIAASGSRITINAHSTFISNKGRRFTNLKDIVLTRSDIDHTILQGSYTLTEGILKTFEVPGTNLSYQTFTIPSLNVSENYFVIETYNPSLTTQPVQWTEIKTAFDLMTAKTMFYVEEDIANEGYPKIVFGGYNIAVPAADEMIKCTYLETTGEVANGDYLQSLPPAASGNYKLEGRRLSTGEFDLTNFNQSYQDAGNTAFGGSFLETLESIKISAPRSFATAGRAVTKADFKTLLDTLFASIIYRSSIVGGEELYPGDSSKLGNIYITAMPYIKGVDFDRLKTAYLDAATENQIIEDIKKYSIISTFSHFDKPSYLRLTANANVEVMPNISVYEKNTLSSQITTTLTNFFNTNFNDLGQPFRKSKMDSEVDNLKSVKSSNVQIGYEFMIQESSFVPEPAQTAITLPMIVSGFDVYGKPNQYTNFVRTNLEQMQFLRKSELALEECSIYGKVFHPNSTRYMYNKDVILIDSFGASSTSFSEIKLYAKNIFAGIQRVDDNLPASVVLERKLINNVAIDVSPNIINGLDNWILTAEGSKIGMIVRNNNVYNSSTSAGEFLGKTATTPGPTFNGGFYEATSAFTVPGVSGTSVSVSAGEYIIYNAVSGLYQVINTANAVDVSALTSVGIFTNVLPNAIYQLSGSASPALFPTLSVSAGDYVMYNNASTASSKWEKMHFISRGLNASLALPVLASDFDLRFVENTYVPTTFGGTTTLACEENDLIFFNPTITGADKWQKIVNIASTASMAALPTTSASGTSIGSIPASARPTGAAFRINVEGVPASGYIDWHPAILEVDRVGYIDDIIVSKGDGTWVIFSNAYSNVYSVDGSNDTSLPSTLIYGDYFSITSSGNFQGVFTTNLLPGDQVAYAGTGWVVKPAVVPQITTELPPDQALGNLIRVVEAGNFNNYALINPACTAMPTSGNFIQGDYLIYTGTYWTPLREYTFKYATLTEDGTDGASMLQGWGFKSLFEYTYNAPYVRFDFNFNDQLHDVVIGQFRYNVPAGDQTALKYEVGKLIFDNTVIGMLDLTNPTFPYPVKSIFSNYGQTDYTLNDPNNPNSYLIRNMDFFRILPKFRYDAIKNQPIYEPVTDFDTIYNQYVVSLINTPVISNEIV
jgi:hypothetical protein